MNIETDRGKVTKRAEPWVLRLICSAIIALSAIVVGRSVFDSITGLFLAEAALGGLAGQKFGGFALPGAVLAFLGWVSFVTLQNDGGFHGEGSAAFVLMLIGTIIFVISGSVVHLITKKWGGG
jgi:hypothetical protein